MRRAIDFHHHGLTIGLRGYQHVVLLDWRELRATAEYPWDRLCDALNGEGVNSVDAALSRLRLRPLHDGLRHAVSVENLRMIAEAAEEVAAPTMPETLTESSASSAENVRQGGRVRPRLPLILSFMVFCRVASYFLNEWLRAFRRKAAACRRDLLSGALILMILREVIARPAKA